MTLRSRRGNPVAPTVSAITAVKISEFAVSVNVKRVLATILSRQGRRSPLYAVLLLLLFIRDTHVEHVDVCSQPTHVLVVAP